MMAFGSVVGSTSRATGIATIPIKECQRHITPDRYGILGFVGACGSDRDRHLRCSHEVATLFQHQEKYMTQLVGKSAIVTGGSVGIGRAIATLFAAEGARVTIADIDHQEGAATVRDIQAAGGTANYVACDVSRSVEVAAMVKNACSAFGPIHILVNNAGIMVSGSVVSTDEEIWDKVIAVNLKGVYLCSKYTLPHICKPGGVIVNIASVAGLYGLRDGAVYNASKGGVVALSKNMALDFAPQGVRINCICPGATVTAQFEQGIARTGDAETTRENMTRLRPIGRLAEAAEIAQVALFLASDASSYMAGSVVVVDGGVTAQFAGQVRVGT
jgi:NAD(P)-dependent dehydrogenase (short-subunit alcohol dehydrogenase family)